MADYCGSDSASGNFNISSSPLSCRVLIVPFKSAVCYNQASYAVENVWTNWLQSTHFSELEKCHAFSPILPGQHLSAYCGSNSEADAASRITKLPVSLCDALGMEYIKFAQAFTESIPYQSYEQWLSPADAAKCI